VLRKLKLIVLFYSSLCLWFGELYAQEKLKLYLIPGQGSDHRVFQDYHFDTSFIDTIHVRFLLPNRGERMLSYASRMAEQIDTNGYYAIMGVSLGGMIACELADKLNPDKVFIVSSAKNRKELPVGYRTQRYVPIYSIVPAGIVKAGSFVLQPLFEPDRKRHKQVFKSMLKDMDKRFIKRAIRLIVTWNREQSPEKVVHIHGAKDSTIPIRRVEADYIIEEGSHMMTLNQAAEIQKIIEVELGGTCAAP